MGNLDVCFLLKQSDSPLHFGQQLLNFLLGEDALESVLVGLEVRQVARQTLGLLLLALALNGFLKQTLQLENKQLLVKNEVGVAVHRILVCGVFFILVDRVHLLVELAIVVFAFEDADAFQKELGGLTNVLLVLHRNQD